MLTPEGRAKGLRRERVLACPRFDGAAFRNTVAAQADARAVTSALAPRGPRGPRAARGDVLREYLSGGERRTPRGAIPVVRPHEAWATAPATGLRATWLGHSTVLLEIDGVRVLTDPVWAGRASPVSFAGPKRFHAAPASIAELPPLDAVLVSHDHYDHLDREAVLALARGGASFVTSLGVGARLEAWGVPHERVVELDWWESVEVRGVRITAAPSHHFSGRSLLDRNRTAWSSFHVRGPRHALFFSGDTGLTADYAEIPSRLGKVDLVMLEVGAFHPAWGDIHLGPENALAAHALLGGGALLPVHWGTFKLALHPWDEPAETLLARAPALGVPLVMPRVGEAVEPARAVEAPVAPWWRAVDEARAAPAAGVAELGLEPGEIEG
ncbi:MAG TPA: MBL fold metallo-hydrolase [Polyangiaceae bacterium]|nr:MBL fold metallo-hydrolase [Polyangiaceae bacterium]